jgi:MoxR-like ATPase
VEDTEFNRTQFTPDKLPSDIVGVEAYNAEKGSYVEKGPIFANFILADEINRAPAKTQAALFEVMEERQITIDGKQYLMAPPFMVLATQNPIEQEGTYALPEAQLDRFLFKIKVDYPNAEEELKILQSHHDRKGLLPEDLITPVLDPEKLLALKIQIREVLIEEKLLNYIAQLVIKTRNHPHLYLGASPRASIALMNASKALAAIRGRDFVIPEDIKALLAPVLAHRIILSPEKEMEGITPENVIEMITGTVEIPR